MRASINDCMLLDLPKKPDLRGNLTFLEGGRHLPFDIKRVFYLYDVPTGESRGAHAHKALHQFLICLAGSFEVTLNDGQNKKVVRLHRPWKGLLIPPMIWAAEENFDGGSICMVLASDYFDEDDYIRDFDQYLKAIAQSK